MIISGRRQDSIVIPCQCRKFERSYTRLLSQDLLKVYKMTRNGMLGSDYSTKFSPWLASGSLSPRLIYEEVVVFISMTRQLL